MAYERPVTCDLNIDVLYAISTYLIPSYTREVPLIIVQEARRRTFYPLLRVCRAFRAAYEPLLYHSVAVRYDDYWRSAIVIESGAWNGVRDWVQRTGLQRERALWETLERRDEVRPWVRRMDLDWDECVQQQGIQPPVTECMDPNSRLDERTRLLGRLSSFLQRFENLHDLTIGPARDRHEEPKILSWPMSVPLTNIRRLDLGALVSFSELLSLFQIPLLNELCLSHVHSASTEVAATERCIPARQPSLIVLKVGACLSEAQILQMLQQPKRIKVLILTIKSCILDENKPPPRPQVLEDALLPFQDHIAVLEVAFEGQKHAAWQPVLGESNAGKLGPVEYCRFEKLRTFENLTHLKMPSFCLFGPIGNRYTRIPLAQRLPPSLETLRIEFCRYDTLFPCTNRPCVKEPTYGISMDPSDYESYVWIIHFGKTASLYLPRLRGVIFHDTGVSTSNYSINWAMFYTWGDSLRQIKDNILTPFNNSGIELGLVGQPGRKCWLCQEAYGPESSGYDDDYWGYLDEYRWEADASLSAGWGPLFGEDPTEYSDSLRGSVAENKDNMMHAKREEVAAEQYYRHLEECEQGIVPSATNSEVSSIPSDDWY